MTKAVSMARLEQIAQEVNLFFRLYQLGVLTFDEAIVEVDYRRVELGFKKLDDEQIVEIKKAMVRRGTI